MYRYPSIFLPDSNFLQVRLKHGHANLYKFMLAIVLYCLSLLLNLTCLSFFSSFSSSTFRPGLSLHLEVVSDIKKRGSGQAVSRRSEEQ